MYATLINTAEEVLRVGERDYEAGGYRPRWKNGPDGSPVGCHASDCSSHHWRYNEDDRFSVSPASAAWVVKVRWLSKPATILFTCRKHTGTLRSLKGRGIRDYEGYEELKATVDEVAADPGKYIDLHEVELVRRKRAADAARAEYIAANRDSARSGYFNTDGYGVPDVGQSALDEYGLTYVILEKHRLRPRDARRLAGLLNEVADRAEEDSLAAEKVTA